MEASVTQNTTVGCFFFFFASKLLTTSQGHKDEASSQCTAEMFLWKQQQEHACVQVCVGMQNQDVLKISVAARCAERQKKGVL